MSVDLLANYQESTLRLEGKTRRVFRRGSGPAVIVLAELPGITPRVVDFADRVAARGLTVVLPSLFGTPGRPPYSSAGATLVRSVLPLCISREFTIFAAGRTSPVTTWLRALARHLHTECGGPGVGVVGMCLTGGFALGMAVDPSVHAPVMSQPSLPFARKEKQKRDVGLDQADAEKIRHRCAADPDFRVLGLRFSRDAGAPPERFAALRDLLGDRFVGVEIDSAPGNPHDIPENAHSVLTEHLTDEPGHPTHDALNQVLDFLNGRLVSTDRSATI